MKRIARSSTEYLIVEVVHEIADVAQDPTGDYDPLIAVVAASTTRIPPTSDLTDTDVWNAATWETAQSRHFARLLVGPNGGVELDPGTYSVWVALDGPTENPVLYVDELVIA